MLTLYDYAPSPHCLRVRLGLMLAGLRYRQVRMTLDGDQKRPGFVARTPFGTVPLVVDGQLTLSQSYAALLWIGEQRPALVGKGAARARVLSWLCASATELDPPVRRAYELAYFTRRRDRAALDEALAELRRVLAWIEAAHAGDGEHAFAAGDALTIADVALFPSFWLVADLVDDFANKLPTRGWRFWRDWYTRLCARPDFARLLAAATES